MKNKIYILRLLTLFIYFLPFTFFYVSCSKLHDGVAYNKKDAAEMKADSSSILFGRRQKEVNDSTKAIEDSSVIDTTNIDTSSLKTTPNNTVEDEPEDTTSLKYKLKETFDDILGFIVFPAKESLSGIGSVRYFKNVFGGVLLGISIFLSIITLMAERFYRNKKNLISYLLLLHIICVLSFIIDGIICHVDLLYGVWCLLSILLIQLTLEIKKGSNLLKSSEP